MGEGTLTGSFGDFQPTGKRQVGPFDGRRREDEVTGRDSSPGIAPTAPRGARPKGTVPARFCAAWSALPGMTSDRAHTSADVKGSAITAVARRGAAAPRDVASS
jgi:hypothetical protein